MRQLFNRAQVLVSSTKGRAALVIALLALATVAGGAGGNGGP